MDRKSRPGWLLGLLFSFSLFVLAPLAVSAAPSHGPFINGIPPGIDLDKFPAKLCLKSIGPSWLNLKVSLPCGKPSEPPPPVDACPNVPGIQTSTPCADDVCEDGGGIWDGDSCEPAPPVDQCPNVPGTQTSTPCADTECVEDGGTWDGDSCNFPPPPEPTLTLNANPITINEGSTSTLSWDSTNATSCVASGGWSGSRSVDGSEGVSPTATTTYSLECSGSGGTTTQSVTVNVIPTPPPVDACPNVPGHQDAGPCADDICEDDGGTWDGDSCVFPPPEGKLVISEVHYDLSNSTTTPQGDETANEWVELYNGTNSSINLGNYVIGDSVSDDTLPDATLPAGAYAVIVASSTTASFYTIPAEAVVVQIVGATIGNGLGNAGDLVYLFDEVASTTVDMVSWGSNTEAFDPSVPVVEANSGHSMARIDVTVDTNTAADWQEQTVPDPGL